MTCKHFNQNLANGMHVSTMGCTSSNTKDKKKEKPLPKTKQTFTVCREVKDGYAIRQTVGDQKSMESPREKFYENRKRRLLTDSSQQNPRFHHPNKKHNVDVKELKISRQDSLLHSSFREPPISTGSLVSISYFTSTELL